jgi:hypothetical protein
LVLQQHSRRCIWSTETLEGFGKIQRFRTIKTLSDKAAEELSALKHLADISIESLSAFDDYAFVEEEIIARLTASALNQTMGLEAIRQIAERRRSSFWYSEYSSAYQIIVWQRRCWML